MTDNILLLYCYYDFIIIKTTTPPTPTPTLDSTWNLLMVILKMMGWMQKEVFFSIKKNEQAYSYKQVENMKYKACKL